MVQIGASFVTAPSTAARRVGGPTAFKLKCEPYWYGDVRTVAINLNGPALQSLPMSLYDAEGSSGRLIGISESST